jgi:hypothetical protein
VRDNQNEGSPIGRILGGLGQIASAANEARKNASQCRCVNCGADIPAQSLWLTAKLRPKKQLLCDVCAKGAGAAAATVLGTAVQRGLSGILGEMFAGREKR